MVNHHRKGCDQKNRENDQENIHGECRMGKNTIPVPTLCRHGDSKTLKELKSGRQIQFTGKNQAAGMPPATAGKMPAVFVGRGRLP